MNDRPGLAFNSTAIENRSILWRSYKEKSTGFLYWAVNAFSSLNPLRPRNDLPAGDGLLIFPGALFGSKSPVVSMRLERWQDGAEDYELLLQMEKKNGRAATEQLLGTIYKNPTEISVKPEYVDKFHTKLLENVAK